MGTPFSLTETDLGPAKLRLLGEADAAVLGPALCKIEPWSVLSYQAATLTSYLSKDDASTRRFAILKDRELAGVAVIRTPWLKGPYLELLAVLPGFQGLGIGGKVLDWMEAEARGHARNLWVLASGFNAGAIRFYESHGFVQTANLDDLATDGCTEILLRKILR